MIHSTEVKTVVQCDFDSTIAEDDISFMLLDTFADGDWRQVLKDYREHKIPVGVFNSRSFGMVKADKQTMLDYIFKRGVKLRLVGSELVAELEC